MNRDGEVTFVLNSRRITGNSLGITALTDDPLFAVGSAGGWRDPAPQCPHLHRKATETALFLRLVRAANAE